MKKWILKDNKGKIIIEGRKKEVVNKMYHRYAYQHIFNDILMKTKENLK